MTSPVELIGLVYDGYDLQRADLNVLFRITEGLDELPAVRGSDDLIPFRTGQLRVPRYADHRPIVLTGWIAGAAPTPQSSYRAYLDGLKTVLDPTRAPALLVATLEDGSARWIEAVPRNLIGGDMLGHEFRPLSAELEALDPLWYRDWGAWTLDAGLYLDDGLYLGEGGSVTVVPTSSTFDVVLNAFGTTDVEKVRVEIDGPLAAGATVTVENLSLDDVGFSYGIVPASQTLVVDSGYRSVTLAGTPTRGGLTLLTGNVHGEYLRLRPGTNTIRIIGQPAAVRLTFPATYL